MLTWYCMIFSSSQESLLRNAYSTEMVGKLVEVLGRVVSCSRPAVDCGWLPSWRQVELPGKTVSPKLYLALGISSAFQHVVSINKDTRSPIFGVSD